MQARASLRDYQHLAMLVSSLTPNLFPINNLLEHQSNPSSRKPVRLHDILNKSNVYGNCSKSNSGL